MIGLACGCGQQTRYGSVLCGAKNLIHRSVVDAQAMRQAVTDALVLAHEKYQAVQLVFGADSLIIRSSNAENEDAENEIDARTDELTTPVVIGVKGTYLLSALDSAGADNVEILFKDRDTAIILRGDGDGEGPESIIMPVRV